MDDRVLGPFLGALRWRCIGPHRGGRVVAVAGHPREPMVFYFGSTGGAVWRTDDGGVTWCNVSDGFFRRASVGALAVAPAGPEVVYVGMGECCIRQNVAHGDGLYRSTDGGRTWVHLDLADSRHIARVRVDPQDPDRVYVAALGHVYGPNPTRGSSAPATTGTAGNGSCSAASARARPTSASTRKTRASSSPRSGRPTAHPTAWSAAVRRAACSAPPTGATPGRS